MSSTQTPAQLGYRMPAEWEPHAATWLSLPRREGIRFPHSFDDVVPTRVAEILKVPVFYPGMILEGGSIEVNGTGALLSSESCLLNKNRNPNLSREEIEKRLRDFLGVREILWLGDGIEGDDTDGHIDDLARFVSEIKVVTVVEENRDDANYQPLQDNLNRLSGFGLD